MISWTRRNLVFAALLAMVLGAGTVFVVRPLATSGSSNASTPASGSGEESATGGGTPGVGTSAGPQATDANGSPLASIDPTAPAPGFAASGSPGSGSRQGGGQSAIRVGGATLDDSYPGFGANGECGLVTNVGTGVPLRITDVAVSPASAFTLSGCIGLGENVDDVVRCAPGVVLAPPGSHPRLACGLQVDQHVLGGGYGTVTVTLAATCTSRTKAPCTRLPTTASPSSRTPVLAIVTYSFQVGGVTGSPTPESSRSTPGGLGVLPTRTPSVAPRPTTAQPTTPSSTTGSAESSP